MPKYLYQANYTPDGFKGLIKDSATGRRDAVESALNALGGKLEAFYFCFGSDDVVLIVELPDNIAAASVAVNVAATGLVRIRTTPLLSVAEADKALGGKVAYRAPGTV
jgi:uncharacterized protein with GYD domain